MVAGVRLELTSTGYEPVKVAISSNPLSYCSVFFLVERVRFELTL